MPVVDYGHDYAQWYSGCHVMHDGQHRIIEGIVDTKGNSYRERRITSEKNVRFYLSGVGTVDPAQVVYTMPEELGIRYVRDADSIVLISRKRARQWKRGVHPRTVSVRCPNVLHTLGFAFTTSNDRALRYSARDLFEPAYSSLRDVFDSPQRRAFAFNSSYWAYRINDKVMLGYRDYMIGELTQKGPVVYKAAEHLVAALEEIFPGMEVQTK